MKTLSLIPSILGNVLKFRKKVINLLQLKVYRISLTTPCEIAEAFPKHFQLAHSNFCPGAFCSANCCADSDVQNAIKCLQQLKSVELDGITNFVIAGCSEICFLVL
jgi:hypothetical protein